MTKSKPVAPKPVKPRFEIGQTIAKFTKIDVSTGCWNWTGYINESGYGHVYTSDASGRHTKKAHRAVYEALVGPIGDGLHLDHLCGNRRCVNPKHLEQVTPRENVMRSNHPMIALHKAARCAKGHDVVGANASPSSGGHLRCRICKNDGWRRRYHRIRPAPKRKGARK